MLKVFTSYRDQWQAAALSLLGPGEILCLGGGLPSGRLAHMWDSVSFCSLPLLISGAHPAVGALYPKSAPPPPPRVLVPSSERSRLRTKA